MDNLRDLMDSILKNDWDTFTKFICNAQHTNDQMNITEMLKNMEKKDLEIIWKEINSKCTQLLQEDYNRPDIYQLLKAISLFALKNVHLKLADQNFFDTVSLLCNTILLPSTGDGDDDDDDELKSLVSSACESLWKDSMDGVEELMPNVVQYLMERCLLPQPKTTFATRLHAIRNAIPCFGLPPKIDRNRLLEVFSDGNFLKIRRKLGALIFCLSVDFAHEVHACLKKLIIISSKSSLSWISQVYFDAWKLAKDSGVQELVECIELDCLSDVIFIAIHSPRNSNSQFVKFFKVLQHFHKDKSSKVVSGLLCKLYSGILFRSLKAPNGMVRANAIFILSDVFPLCDLNKGQEFNEDLLHQQLKEFENLMEDANIKARQATVAGMFNIFNNYWQLIPLDKRKSLIMKMMQFCAWDATSSGVRLDCLCLYSELLNGSLTLRPCYWTVTC